MSSNLRIAIDGGAATGKSTISAKIAKELGIKYINTGLMYRLFAYIALKNNLLEKNNILQLKDKIEKTEMHYDENGNIASNDIEFKIDDLNKNEISVISSKLAAIPEIRKIATEKQILIAKEKGVLMEGRDIGTVIMTDADFKFFVTVDAKEAANRRFNHHEKLGHKNIEWNDIYKDILERNERDRNRKIAPTIPTKESIVIDTTNISPEQVIEKILEVINNA